MDTVSDCTSVATVVLSSKLDEKVEDFDESASKHKQILVDLSSPLTLTGRQKVVTTPAYMCAKSIAEVSEAIDKLVKKILSHLKKSSMISIEN